MLELKISNVYVASWIKTRNLRINVYIVLGIKALECWCFVGWGICDIGGDLIEPESQIVT